MDEEAVMYLAFCAVVLLLALTITPKMGGKIFSIVGGMMIAMAGMLVVVLNFADYIAVSLGFNLIGITFQPALGYKINREQKAVLKTLSGIYYATGYLSANLFAYEFKQEVQDEETERKMIRAPINWELAVTNITFPFKYHVISSGLSVQNVRDELEGKRSYEEYQLAKVLQNSEGKDVAIAEIQRKINVIQRKMDRISGGEKPVGTVMYVETTAIGISEKAAVDALERQIAGLQIALSPMNVDLQRIVGRELYSLFRFNFAMPLSYDEMSTYFDKQS